MYACEVVCVILFDTTTHFSRWQNEKRDHFHSSELWFIDQINYHMISQCESLLCTPTRNGHLIWVTINGNGEKSKSKTHSQSHPIWSNGKWIYKHILYIQWRQHSEIGIQLATSGWRKEKKISNNKITDYDAQKISVSIHTNTHRKWATTDIVWQFTWDHFE